MTDDLDALSALAEAATPGPWALATWGPVLTKAWVDYDADTTGTVVPPADWLCIAGQPIPDAAYIAAMSPDVALALIARVQKAEAERAEAEREADRALMEKEIYCRRVGEERDAAEAALSVERIAEALCQIVTRDCYHGDDGVCIAADRHKRTAKALFAALKGDSE